MSQIQLSGPSWDLTSEYKNLEDPRIEGDFREVLRLIDSIKALAERASKQDKWAEVLRLHEEAETLLGSLMTFGGCLSSEDTRNAEAVALASRANEIASKLEICFEPFRQIMSQTDPSALRKFSAKKEHAIYAPFMDSLLKKSGTLLPQRDEELVELLESSGLDAWQTLYQNLMGSLQVEWEQNGKTHKMGMAASFDFLSDPSEDVRRLAYGARQRACESRESAFAIALDSIVGWRSKILSERAKKTALEPFSLALINNKLESKTFRTAWDCVMAHLPALRESVFLMARILGEKQLSPWNLLAPLPSRWSQTKPIEYDHGLAMVKEAFCRISPELGAFVDLASNQRWIEGRVTDYKRTGAYCTLFTKTRTPRVYMTYTGTIKNLYTLAHELGHAFHAWLMRDLSLYETEDGQSLGETASTFGEAALTDLLKAQSHEASWQEIQEIAMFTLGIPARYQFELDLHKARERGSLTPALLKNMAIDAVRSTYGESLSEPNPLYWVQTLHYYLSYAEFYNFPYLIAFLFSQGIFRLRGDLGAAFFTKYCAFLRDSGSLSCEDIFRKHFDLDITKEQFWNDTLDHLVGQIEKAKKQFEG